MTQYTLPIDYNPTFLALKERINQGRFECLKVVNTELILIYLEIGKVVSAKVATGWGDAIVNKLSLDLQNEYPGVKGFSLRNIRRMKYVHEKCLLHSILPQLVAKLPWGHTDYIFTKIKQSEPIVFYLQKCAERGWSRSILEEEIRFDAFSKSRTFQNNFPKTVDSKQLMDYRLEF